MKTSQPLNVCRKRGKVSRHVVQTISGEATKRNKEKRSVVPHYHRQASLKHLVQENPSGKEHHKNNHEKHEKALTAEGSVSREEFDQP